ncbi:rho guanine nucleotide exchange factor 33 isoform X2 [Corythoichthys intestinalis]|uniref:rho guanine nucleotide exchange factor 33 isoform X2 n=1 Tax=Corythoichthys intestinalis TaxID=161448 RepID=UPI0025A5AF4E|nr:rho guanine nucleotide exchange factor 33 isoform X2 [Corythoichthys intestinalis]
MVSLALCPQQLSPPDNRLRQADPLQGMHSTQLLSRGSTSGGAPPQQKQVMKHQEAELIAEIEKLQCLVSELKTGFSDAMLELTQIQHGDSLLRDEMEDHRRRCGEKARRSEALVESLREELAAMRCQVLALRDEAQQQQRDAKSAQLENNHRDTQVSSQSDAPEACRGKVLLRCFLQGLKAGLTQGTDARHQVALQLLHSEWEYVSTLKQLYDKYKTTPHVSAQPHEALASSVQRLLGRHLLFRNNLQERLSAQRWKSLLGDLLVQLVGQNDTSFSDAYVGYSAVLASFLSLDVLKLDTNEDKQVGEAHAEGLSLLWLLLAPVSRLHGYLTHIQNLLQRTSEDHPDYSLLLGTERALGHVLWRCHAILEEDVRWEAPGSDAAMASGSTADGAPCRTNGECAATRMSQQASALTNGDPFVRVERWPCSPVRRPNRQCAHARCCSVTPEPPSADASALDDSSATSCRDDDDSQVPVLLKPSERSVRLRWEIPERTLAKRLSIRAGSPPLQATSAFRPIWEQPSPEKEHRGFVPVQTSAGANFPAMRQDLRARQGPPSVAPPSGQLWEDSEDSEGPCSTV